MGLFNIIVITIISFFGFLSAEETYKIIDLNPPESIRSFATDINEKGQVVGLYFSKEIPSSGQIFLWDIETGFQFLGKSLTPPLINNLGHVVGTRKVSDDFFENLINPSHKVFIWRPETGVQLLERPLNADLENLPLNDSTSNANEIKDLFPVAFNDHEQILIRNHSTYSKADKVWVWHENSYKKIEGLSSANFLSNEQKIAGISKQTLSKYEKMFMPTLYDLQNDTNVIIPFSQKQISGNALTIDNKGNTLGKIYDFKTKVALYYLWHPTEGFKNLPKNLLNHSMNSQGEILGFLQSKRYLELHLYDGNKTINIEKEAGIGYSPKVEILAIYTQHKIKMNGNHQIIGTGYVRDNYMQRHAFLIYPLEQNKTFNPQ